eukprot:TRINITY_DN5233_c0_g1_i1.p1 TRINITY_DN5233_c0_g1~~TRINITY_DN5233_c0_g1_i1.p1  ORF type:complete len:163 (+),score=20.12 TRINITY_DN5233_c0_g1_i1:47-535(+)
MLRLPNPFFRPSSFSSQTSLTIPKCFYWSREALVTSKWNNAIARAIEWRQFFRAFTLYRRMALNGVQRDSETYKMMIKMYVSLHDNFRAERMYELSKNEGVRLDEETYAILVRNFERSKQPEKVTGLEQEIQQLGLDSQKVVEWKGKLFAAPKKQEAVVEKV